MKHEYKCVVLPVMKLTASPTGFKRPLCNDCQCKDCTHPIMKRRMAFGGVTETVRLYCQGRQIGMVVQCDGYIPPKPPKEEPKDEDGRQGMG